MIDYGVFQKDSYASESELGSTCEWDLFISSFNESERVRVVFDSVRAGEKFWVRHQEYDFTDQAVEVDAFFSPRSKESEFVDGFAKHCRLESYRYGRVCIDATGFLRPQLLFLLYWLRYKGFSAADFLYAEPRQYVLQEDTAFSDEEVTEVRQVEGFEGIHNAETSKDLLIIGTGYDHALIAAVAKSKDHARKVQVLGLPSLAPDMYQENIIRVQRASEAVGVTVSEPRGTRFCPANDPFVTAQVLSAIVEQEAKLDGVSNLYLSPLGTKPQVLGFGLYYLNERSDTPASLLFPFHRKYSSQTSVGCGRIWLYHVEFI